MRWAVGGSDDQDLPECHVHAVCVFHSGVVDASSPGAVSDPDYRMSVRADILAAWHQAADDTVDQPEIWLQYDAPVGITMSSTDRGILPVATDECVGPALLGTDELGVVSTNAGAGNFAEDKFKEFVRKGKDVEFPS